MSKTEIISHLVTAANYLDSYKDFGIADEVNAVATRLAQDWDEGGYSDSDRMSEMEGVDDYNRYEENELFRDREGESELEDEDEYDRDGSYLTIERGEGSTYRDQEHSVTLYRHDIYPESSVLAGQDRRIFEEKFEEFPTREENIKAAQEFATAHYPGMQVDVYEGSSHREPYLGHLPDDDDGGFFGNDW